MAGNEERAGFGQRILRAAKLEASLYDEVKADNEATGQALGVVVLAVMADGLGRKVGIGAIVTGVILGIGSWYLGALLIYWLGTKVLPEPQTEADVGGVLRATGFSSAPGLIGILATLPNFQVFVPFVAGIWMVIADVIAVRQALNYRSTGRALAVYVIVILVTLAVFFPLASWLGLLPESM